MINLGYRRVSSQSQVEGHGLEGQKDIIVGHESEISEWYNDAYTGTAETRPYLEILFME